MRKSDLRISGVGRETGLSILQRCHSRRVWTVQSIVRPGVEVSYNNKGRKIVIRFLMSYPRNWHLCPCRNTEKKTTRNEGGLLAPSIS